MLAGWLLKHFILIAQCANELVPRRIQIREIGPRREERSVER